MAVAGLFAGSFGHACGDHVINAFADCLKDVSAGHLIVARLGGEEFAVMLPGANLATGRLVAKGARVAFSALPVAGLPAERRFTASFGVAEMQPGEGLASLLRRADDALYEAKTAGRDCVRMRKAGNGPVPTGSASKRRHDPRQERGAAATAASSVTRR